MTREDLRILLAGSIASGFIARAMIVGEGMSIPSNQLINPETCFQIADQLLEYQIKEKMSKESVPPEGYE